MGNWGSIELKLADKGGRRGRSGSVTGGVQCAMHNRLHKARPRHCHALPARASLARHLTGS
ncbi:hypothetical protein J6590_045852 [Homalodisca vitripennis]|nr:hypothetical protein J6590_045852 [Homalodisca vitripennis]